MKLKVTTIIKGSKHPPVVNTHDWVNPQMLKEALGKRGFAELSVTGKHVQEDELEKATYELIKGE